MDFEDAYYSSRRSPAVKYNSGYNSGGSEAQWINLSEAEKTERTISDDRTNQHEIEKRNLLALGYEKVGTEPHGTLPTEDLIVRGPPPHWTSGYETPKVSPQPTGYLRPPIMLDQHSERGKWELSRQEGMEKNVINQEQPQISQGMGNQNLKRTWSPSPSIVGKASEAPAWQSLWSPSGRSAVPNQTVPLGQTQPDTQDDCLSTKEVQALREQMSLLEAKLRQFESASDSSTPSPSRFQYLYRLRRAADGFVDEEDRNPSIFLDPPETVYDQSKNEHLRCNLPLRDLDLFLAQHQDISFVVFRDYDRQSENNSPWTDDMPQIPYPLSESIYPVANDLKIACDLLFQDIAGIQDIETHYESTGEIRAPYHFLYHSWTELNHSRNKMPSSARDAFELLLNYVKESFGPEYAIVDSLLEKERISLRYLSYLFKPGEVIVEANEQDYIGYIASSWMIDRPIKYNSVNVHSEDVMDAFEMSSEIFQPFTSARKASGPRKGPQPKRGKQRDSSKDVTHELEAWTLNFDGKFLRKSTTLTIKVLHESSTETGNDSEQPSIRQDSIDLARPICSLNVFPLRFAPEAVREILKRRGNTFWKFRERQLVSYHGKRIGEGVDMTDERYMVDMESYKKLHSSTSDSSAHQISPEAINNPNGKYQFLLPLRIKAYNLRHKKWFEISADCISDVKWNREAFQSLVMERKSKELIQALVTSQIEAEQATDLISGKGNGLILLLHGGPGTGKTLTAESVAEIAEKPLYRVTCGDVGTKAEQVEKYLESVLYLGRIWGCVVLLDEADVFLEQRSLEDLERNALVSVFLRVLEYYDGILVLTSNRVGTFDEAFRSRIQLALHYPNLGPAQRFRIWQTFIDKLSNMATEEQIDIDDLRDNLHLLKEEKMNGRQIRNVITTARQYAKWKKEPLTYEYMKDAIEISCRFDGYLSKLRGGFSDDEIAQDDGLRLA
ncbi:hypothetical protein N7528_003490 [Penicillium herquei]|nr:hypothetical protein N7528_003490 [Penicillium herquei]